MEIAVSGKQGNVDIEQIHGTRKKRQPSPARVIHPQAFKAHTGEVCKASVDLSVSLARMHRPTSKCGTGRRGEDSPKRKGERRMCPLDND